MEEAVVWCVEYTDKRTWTPRQLFFISDEDARAYQDAMSHTVTTRYRMRVYIDISELKATET